MYTIVSTIGTSAIEKFLKSNLYNNSSNPIAIGEGKNVNNEFNILQSKMKKANKNRLSKKTGCEVSEDFYRSFINRYIEKSPAHPPWHRDNSWEDDDWFMMPAEVASILRISEYLDEENYLESEHVLVKTDTEESRISAEITKSLLRKYGFKNIRCKTVEDFQMENISLFNGNGIENFMKIIDDTNKKAEEMVLNVTGGYKSFIPFASSIASFNKVDMYYVHETAVPQKDSLVKIPYVPIFNSAMAEEENVVTKTIRRVERDSSLTSESDAWQLVETSLKRELGPKTNYEAYTNFILSFFDFSNDKVMKTPIGSIYYHYLLEGKEE